MRHLKKRDLWKPMEVNRTCISFTNFLYIFDCCNITICKKKRKVKDEASKKNRETYAMEVKLRSKMSHLPKIPHRYAHDAVASIL